MRAADFCFGQINRPDGPDDCLVGCLLEGARGLILGLVDLMAVMHSSDRIVPQCADDGH
jgi:hypothetical protein